jgi:plasmid maintenance system killer protein
VIQGFRGPETEQVFRRERARRLPADVQRIAQINLQARHDLEAEKDRLCHRLQREVLVFAAK